MKRRITEIKNLSDKNKGLFTKEYLIICLVTTLLRLSMFIKSLILPLYVLDLGFSKTAAGITTTVFTISALVLRPLVGSAIEKLGRKRMLIIGMILFTISTFPIGYTGSLLIIYLFQSLNGLGFSIHSVALTTMVTDIIPENRLTKGLGYYGLTATISQAVGPVIALWAVDFMGYVPTFLFSGILCALSIALSVFITYEKGEAYRHRKHQYDSERDDSQKIWYRLFEKNAILPAFMMGTIALITASTSTFLVPYANEVNIAQIGLFFTARAIGVAISRVFAERITIKLGNSMSLCIGSAGVVVGLAAICFVREIYLLAAIAVIYGIGFGIVSLVLNVTSVLNTPKHRRAVANATYYLAMDAGIGIGAAAWGIVADGAGLGNLFIVAAGLSVILSAMFWVIRKRVFLTEKTDCPQNEAAVP